MKLVLAAITSSTCDTRRNKNRIIDLIRKYSNQAEMILFGEAFLQGFYSMNFDYEHDVEIALPVNSDVIDEIRKASEKYNTGVSFGMFEKDGNLIFSSQITISAEGQIIDHFRRVSAGWKENKADVHYAEGKSFHCFEYRGKKIAIGLCGDLWYNDNVSKVNALHPDIVFWPVYTDLKANEWNTTIKYEYCEQAKCMSQNVVYVNSVCTDQPGEEIAKGGTAFFKNGVIALVTPSGEESELIVNID